MSQYLMFMTFAVVIGFCVAIILVLYAARYMHERQARRLSRAQRWCNFAQSRTGVYEPTPDKNAPPSSRDLSSIGSIGVRILSTNAASNAAAQSKPNNTKNDNINNTKTLSATTSTPMLQQHVIDIVPLPSLHPVPLSPIPEDFVIRDSFEKKLHESNISSKKQPLAAFVQHYGSCAPTAVAA